MRYLIGFVCVAVLVGSPQSASAQDGEKGATSEPNAQEPAPSSEPAPEEPALQLELGDAGVEVAPSSQIEEYRKTQLRRARIGLATSVIAFGGGAAMAGVGFANIEWGSNFCFFEPCPQTPPWAITLAVIGPLLAIGGLAGMIVSGRNLADSKKQFRWYARASESRHGRARRAQWDLAWSRLVF